MSLILPNLSLRKFALCSQTLRCRPTRAWCSPDREGPRVERSVSTHQTAVDARCLESQPNCVSTAPLTLASLSRANMADQEEDEAPKKPRFPRAPSQSLSAERQAQTYDRRNRKNNARAPQLPALRLAHTGPQWGAAAQQRDNGWWEAQGWEDQRWGSWKWDSWHATEDRSWQPKYSPHSSVQQATSSHEAATAGQSKIAPDTKKETKAEPRSSASTLAEAPRTGPAFNFHSSHGFWGICRRPLSGSRQRKS